MKLPDVIGFVLEEAHAELGKQGWQIGEILVTKPFKATEPLGKARVVRLSPAEGQKLRVVVAYQDYEKGGVRDGIQDY